MIFFIDFNWLQMPSLRHLPLSGRVAHHNQVGRVEGEQGHGRAHLVFIPLDLLKSSQC